MLLSIIMRMRNNNTVHHSLKIYIFKYEGILLNVVVFLIKDALLYLKHCLLIQLNLESGI